MRGFNDEWFIIVILSVITFNMLDFLTTVLSVRFNVAYETNPLLASHVTAAPIFFLIKLIGSLLIILFAALIKNSPCTDDIGKEYPRIKRYSLITVIIVPVLIPLVCVFNNAFVMLRCLIQ